MESKRRRYQALADRIKEARTARGMSQRQLSRALGKSQGYTGHLESGRIRPTVATLKSLAAVLGLMYGQLAVDAGLITQAEFESPIDDKHLARLSEVGDLTDEEWESVQDFVRYVKSRASSTS